MVFVWRASAGCLVFAHAVGLCNDLSANSILGAGKVQLLSEEHHLAVFLVPVRAKWHLCGGFVGGGLSRVVPSRTAVLPPASGYGLPLPILSPNPAFPTSPSCSQWLWAAYCPDWCCGSWWRSWLQLQALAPSHRACPSFWWQAARRGVAMVGLCPAGGRAAVPLLAEAVPQHWAGVWLWTAVGSVPLPPKPCIPVQSWAAIGNWAGQNSTCILTPECLCILLHIAWKKSPRILLFKKSKNL